MGLSATITIGSRLAGASEAQALVAAQPGKGYILGECLLSLNTKLPDV